MVSCRTSHSLFVSIRHQRRSLSIPILCPLSSFQNYHTTKNQTSCSEWKKPYNRMEEEDIVQASSPSNSRIHSVVSSSWCVPEKKHFVLGESRYGRSVPASRAYTVTALAHDRGVGSRGSRGHGWYVNYRNLEKNDRHLRGEYFDREDIDFCTRWNQSILDLGSTTLFLDVLVAPDTGMNSRSSSSSANKSSKPNESNDSNESNNSSTSTMESNNSNIDNTDDSTKASSSTASSTTKNTTRTRSGGVLATANLRRSELEKLEGVRKRLTIEIASAIMPETAQNFINLCTGNTSRAASDCGNDGYIGSKLYRFEKGVGICGGDVLTNTGRSGMAAHPQSNDVDMPSVRLDIHDDPLALWHIPGTITMLVPKVGSIDSRFLMCTHQSRHMDGIHRAFGQLTPESLRTIQDWSKSILTFKGVPTSFNIYVLDCGIVLPTNSDVNSTNTPDHTFVAATTTNETVATLTT